MLFFGTLGTWLFYLVLGGYAMNGELSNEIKVIENLKDIGHANTAITVVNSMPFNYLMLLLAILIINISIIIRIIFIMLLMVILCVFFLMYYLFAIILSLFVLIFMLTILYFSEDMVVKKAV